MFNKLSFITYNKNNFCVLTPHCKHMLSLYQTSILEINFYNSKIGRLGVEEIVGYGFSKVLYYSITKIPFIYLAMSAGRNLRKQ